MKRVSVLYWNKLYFSHEHLTKQTNKKTADFEPAHNQLQLKEIGFLALQFNKKNQYKIIYQKKGIKMYMVSCF